MISIVNHTLRANGIRQNYIDAGQGAPVVLLHGFPETNYAWRHQIPVLGERYRLIAPDLRGYGETDKPASGYDKRTMANWAWAGSRWSATIAGRVSPPASPRTIQNVSTGWW